MTEMTYEDKLHKVCEDLRFKNGSFSAREVLAELQTREWASPLDTVIDIHKQLKEMYGDPDGK